jgi:hypothetical protein
MGETVAQPRAFATVQVVVNSAKHWDILTTRMWSCGRFEGASRP